MRTLVLSLVTIVTLLSAAVATRQSDPPPGKVPYDRTCAGCHGAHGEGEQGPSLIPMTLEYAALLAKVRGGGNEMPALSKNDITDDEVKQVYEYLKSLSPR
jgi:mono/diheme cytochrome c family protein